MSVDFNPDALLRVLPDIRILTKAGVETPVNNRIVRLDTGASLVLDIDDATEDIVLGTATSSDLYYTQKYNALVNMVEGGNVSGPYLDPVTGVTPTGDSWNFTDDSMYITKLSNVGPEPETGVAFLVNDACATLIPDINTLILIDICGPCLDCVHYDTFHSYLLRIQEMVEYIWKLTGDKTTNTIPIPPDGTDLEYFTGVYLQSLAVMNYWNYLVHKQSVKSSTQSFGQSISTAAYYSNISDGSVGPITLTIKFSFLQRIGPSLFTWNGVSPANTDIRVIDREGKPSAPLATGPTYTANSVAVNLDAGTLLSGEVIYGDVVLMITDTSLFETSSDQILIVSTVTFSTTHIGDDVQLTDTVYFRAPDGGDDSGSA